LNFQKRYTDSDMLIRYFPGGLRKKAREGEEKSEVEVWEELEASVGTRKVEKAAREAAEQARQAAFLRILQNPPSQTTAPPSTGGATDPAVTSTDLTSASGTRHHSSNDRLPKDSSSNH
jgi:hypothetical protein